MKGNQKMTKDVEKSASWIVLRLCTEQGFRISKQSIPTGRQ